MTCLARCLTVLTTLFAILAPVFAEPSQPVGPASQKKWRLTFADEFEGTKLDTSKWSKSKRGKVLHWQSTQSEEADENGFLDGKGNFVLRVSQDDRGVYRYHHGLETKGKFQQTYGYFETRAKFTHEPGWWGAVWLNGITKGHNPFVFGQEIDIFEDFVKPKVKKEVSHAVHIDAQPIGLEYGKPAEMFSTNKLARFSPSGKNLVDDWNAFHVLGALWTPLEYVFSCDGQEVFRLDYLKTPVTNQPMHVLISMCFRDGRVSKIAGDYLKAKLPDELVVDCVRAWEEDVPADARPRVTLRPDKPAEQLGTSETATFQVTAEGGQGKIEKVYLFDNGRIRAAADGASSSFTISRARLFDGKNVLIAMAKDSSGVVGLSHPRSLTVSEAQKMRASSDALAHLPPIFGQGRPHDSSNWRTVSTKRAVGTAISAALRPSMPNSG
jgi:beta-glucanase (GH16 family)